MVLQKNKRTPSARRVQSGCFYHDRADCEAGATAAIKSARTPGLDVIADEVFVGLAFDD